MAVSLSTLLKHFSQTHYNVESLSLHFPVHVSVTVCPFVPASELDFYTPSMIDWLREPVDRDGWQLQLRLKPPHRQVLHRWIPELVV